ncbi:MAG: glutaredoxin-like protein [Cryomorphaceae bacterium]|jgi:glutaredoxin-like protein
MNNPAISIVAPSMQGQPVPEVTFRVRKNDQWHNITSTELFADKTVVLFSLPGAFTPTCSSTHLPRYNELAATFEQNGVDDIICMSVNDTFVMNAWQQDQEAENITVVPDGNGEFTDRMGMLVGKEDLGFGKRSWRYSMLVRNGTVEKMFVEPNQPGDPFEVSDADTMLDYINPQARKPSSVAIITKPGCPFCVKAKALLNDKNISFEEIVLGKDATSVSVKAISGNTTVPQVFFDGKNIGGSDDLELFLQDY